MSSTLDAPETSKPPAQLPSEDALGRLRSRVPLIVLAVCGAAILLSVGKIMSFGYLPLDDALRHAGKAVCGKPWDQILVMRPGFEIDHNYGWHVILGALHQAFGWGADKLVVFSFTSLFLLFALAPLPWLRRPEAWVAVLVGYGLYGSLNRMTFGRPFILTSAFLLVILLLWSRRQGRASPGLLAATISLMGLSVWIHGSWYLFALPIFAFLLARRWRQVAELSGCWLAGSVLGACLTGHPVGFLVQHIRIVTTAFGNNTVQGMLAFEFQPSDGAFFAVITTACVLSFRKTAGKPVEEIFRDPIFILAGLGWLLGLRVVRFWDDWGIVAWGLWLALQIQDFLESRWSRTDLARLTCVAIAAGGLYIQLTNDYGGRWTRSLRTEYLVADDPELAGWLPEKGGILYSPDMLVFYRTFFKNPNAEWRYILGFEPTFMPEEDLKIFRNIQWNGGESKSYMPWVKKMGSHDRLAILQATKPDIDELEWRHAPGGIWLGRLPVKGSTANSMEEKGLKDGGTANSSPSSGSIK